MLKLPKSESNMVDAALSPESSADTAMKSYELQLSTADRAAARFFDDCFKNDCVSERSVELIEQFRRVKAAYIGKVDPISRQREGCPPGAVKSDASYGHCAVVNVDAESGDMMIVRANPASSGRQGRDWLAVRYQRDGTIEELPIYQADISPLDNDSQSRQISLAIPSLTTRMDRSSVASLEFSVDHEFRAINGPKTFELDYYGRSRRVSADYDLPFEDYYAALMRQSSLREIPPIIFHQAEPVDLGVLALKAKQFAQAA